MLVFAITADTNLIDLGLGLTMFIGSVEIVILYE